MCYATREILNKKDINLDVFLLRIRIKTLIAQNPLIRIPT